jgi:hypothetical protein
MAVGLVATIATAMSLAACGGSSTSTLADYSQSVAATRGRVDFALARVTRAASKDEFLSRMDEASAVIDDAASTLDDDGAAEGFEDETGKLVDALHALSADLAAFAHDARQPGGDALLVGGPGLNFESWDNANEVLTSLREQGIEVEPIGRH